MTTYDIELTLLHGRDLVVKDEKTSDPYVIFDVDGKSFKTKVCNSTLNPDWNNKFKFQMREGESITFHCWDKDLVGSDDKMGDATWTCPKFYNGQEIVCVLKNDVQGQITIKVKCVCGGAVAKNELRAERNPLRRQTVLFQVYSVEKLEQPMNHERLKKPEKVIIALKGATTTTVCGVNKCAQLGSLTADKRNKIEPRDCYFETEQELEKVEIIVSASQKAKRPQEVVLSKGSMMVKLMREKEKVHQTITLSNGVVLYYALQCVTSVWDDVQPDVVDKYFANCEAKITEMTEKGMFTSMATVAPNPEPPKEEPKPEPVVEEPVKEEPKPEPVQQSVPQQPMMQQPMMGSVMQPGMMPQQPMMGSVMQPGMMGSVMQPGMQPMMGSVMQPGMMPMQQPMMGSVMQPGMMASVSVAQPAVIAQPMGASYIVPGQFM